MIRVPITPGAGPHRAAPRRMLTGDSDLGLVCTQNAAWFPLLSFSVLGFAVFESISTCGRSSTRRWLLASVYSGHGLCLAHACASPPAPSTEAEGRARRETWMCPLGRGIKLPNILALFLHHDNPSGTVKGCEPHFLLRDAARDGGAPRPRGVGQWRYELVSNSKSHQSLPPKMSIR